MFRLKCLFVLAFASLAAACGDDDDGACDPVAGSGCDEGLVCEVVTGGDPVCATPLVVRGNVFDIADGSAVAGARVVAIDANGSPASSVAITDMDGNYELAVPAERTSDGAIVDADVTLRVDASGYQAFPFGLRPALPISIGAAVEMEGELVVDSAVTSVGLLDLPDDPAVYGTGAISGTVAVPDTRAGILVVAEISTGAGTARGYSAIADRDGDYAIFNLPDGTYDVTAYALGSVYEHESTDVAGDDVNVDLALDDATATGSVSGSVQIVNPEGGTDTSVILVVESTFNENAAKGVAPPGIRVPEPGVEPNVTGAYAFEGVPPGRYVVLAAFENDGLVRDPDTSIGGTTTLHITVTAGMETVVEGFKVTGALEVLGPGEAGPEEVTGTPTFEWVDDSSEDYYHVEVYDAFGTLVWEEPMVIGPGGSDPATVQYGGPALESGMWYQWRATSWKDGAPISRTEDLKGVFFLP